MCYELYVKRQKSAQDQRVHKPVPVIEKVPAAKPPAQRQPVTQPRERQGFEAESVTNAA